MKTRQQLIWGLKHLSEVESGSLSHRLQQCNVRVRRANGSRELNFEIRTPLQLARALTDDPTIEAVEYQFNGKWTKID